MKTFGRKQINTPQSLKLEKRDWPHIEKSEKADTLVDLTGKKIKEKDQGKGKKKKHLAEECSYRDGE